ncbi:MAG: oligosaccharide flippase family protein [Balneolales bacterium]
MDGSLSRLIKQGGLYALGNTVIKLSGLILAPFYLNPSYLAQAAYGQLILIEITAQVLILVGGAGLGAGLVKFMTDSSYRPDHDKLPATALLFSLGLAAAMAAALGLAATPAARFIFDTPGGAGIIHLAGLYIGLKILAGVPLAFIRIKERAGLYVLAISMEMVSLILGVYYFLVVAGLGLTGIMYAYILSAAVSSGLVITGMLFQVRWSVNPQLLKNLTVFGVPLILAGLASQLLNAGDRYVLKWFTGAEVVAVYGWAGKLSSVINMLFVQSFQMAFGVIGLKALNEQDHPGTFFRRVFRHYIIWTGWAVLGLSLFAYDITSWISPNREYLAVEGLVFPIALGYMGYGLYYIAMNVLYSEMKTRVIAGNMAVACGMNLLLNILLIPYYGAMAAALSTTFSYGFLLFLTVRKAGRILYIPYPWNAAASVTGILLGLYLLSLPSVAWEPVYRLAWRAALLICFPALMVMLKLYPWTEIRNAIHTFKK